MVAMDVRMTATWPKVHHLFLLLLLPLLLLSLYRLLSSLTNDSSNTNSVTVHFFTEYFSFCSLSSLSCVLTVSTVVDR